MPNLMRATGIELLDTARAFDSVAEVLLGENYEQTQELMKRCGHYFHQVSILQKKMLSDWNVEDCVNFKSRFYDPFQTYLSQVMNARIREVVDHYLAEGTEGAKLLCGQILIGTGDMFDQIKEPFNAICMAYSKYKKLLDRFDNCYFSVLGVKGYTRRQLFLAYPGKVKHHGSVPTPDVDRYRHLLAHKRNATVLYGNGQQKGLIHILFDLAGVTGKYEDFEQEIRKIIADVESTENVKDKVMSMFSTHE